MTRPVPPYAAGGAISPEPSALRPAAARGRSGRRLARAASPSQDRVTSPQPFASVAQLAGTHGPALDQLALQTELPMPARGPSPLGATAARAAGRVTAPAAPWDIVPTDQGPRRHLWQVVRRASPDHTGADRPPRVAGAHQSSPQPRPTRGPSRTAKATARPPPVSRPRARKPTRADGRSPSIAPARPRPADHQRRFVPAPRPRPNAASFAN